MIRRGGTMSDGGDFTPSYDNAGQFAAALQTAQDARDQAAQVGAAAQAVLISCQASLAAAQASLAKIQAAQLLGAITAQESAYLAAQHPGVATQAVQGFQLPTSQKAIIAGSKAMANQLTLEAQAGNITQAQLAQAIAALTPAAT